MAGWRTIGLIGLAFGAAIGATAQAQKPERETIVNVPRADPQMNAARDRALAELPDFFRHFAHPGPGERRFMIKFDIIPGERAEFVWAGDIDRSTNPMTGILVNQPEWIDGYRIGQRVPIREEDIVDWSYFQGGVMQGSYTQRVLLERIDPAEAARLREAAGW